MCQSLQSTGLNTQTYSSLSPAAVAAKYAGFWWKMPTADRKRYQL